MTGASACASGSNAVAVVPATGRGLANGEVQPDEKAAVDLAASEKNADDSLSDICKQIQSADINKNQ